MPKLPLSDKELIDRQLRGALKRGQELQRLKNKDMAKKLGCHPDTYYDKLEKFPEKFTLRELRRIAVVLHLTGDEIAKMVLPEQ